MSYNKNILFGCFLARGSFYYYALILSIFNAVQAVGSMLWYKGLDQQKIGQSGIWYCCAFIGIICCHWLPTQHGHTDYYYL